MTFLDKLEQAERYPNRDDPNCDWGEWDDAQELLLDCAAELIAVARAADLVATDRKLCLGMTADECLLCDALAALKAKVEAQP